MSTVDLSGGATRTETITLVLPDRPDAQWFVLALPLSLAELDDPGVTARQVTVDASATMREALDASLYPAVLARRERARESA